MKIRYGHSDEARQNIPWVEYNTPDGKSVEYATPDAKPGGAGLDIREMDCMDCHNRPSHTYEMPERAVDRALNAGLIEPSLPFAKKEAVEVLKANYASRDEAARRIPESLRRLLPPELPASMGRAPGPSERRRRPRRWRSTTATSSPT